MRELVLPLVAAYLIGCIVAAYYIVRWVDGIDIRTLGSGTAGATNVMRSHGRWLSIATFTWDAGKAAFAVWMVRWLIGLEWAAYLGLGAVIAGHVWPIQLGFRGGKGVASWIGGMLMADPVAGAVSLAIGLAAYGATRWYVRSGLLAIAVTPIVLIVFHRQLASVCFAALAVMIVLVAHLPRRARTLPVTGASR